MKCIICDQEFVAKRAGAKLCSPKCRKANSRLNKVNTEVNTEIGKIPKESLTIETLEEKIKEEREIYTLPPKVPVREEYKGSHPPFDMCPKHNGFYSSCKCK
jgi:hypothetical protein